MLKTGDMVWIEDEELPESYRFFGVLLEEPKERQSPFEDMLCKILSDGEIYYIEPQMVHPVDDKKEVQQTSS